MEMMDQPIADAYKTVNNVMGNALDVVFELSSWFTDYETAPYTNIGEIGPDGVSLGSRVIRHIVPFWIRIPYVFCTFPESDFS
jgi:hypothetical protein